jgi:pimeloyl-ACP methyl ester carboxylesterase
MRTRTSLVTLPSGTVAYDEHGTGPIIVLLPSGAHDRTDFDELRARLPETVRTIAMDWPGHGDSPAPIVPGTVTSYADIAEQFVAHIAPDGAVLVGNSIGGFSAGRLAARRPELVTGLVLIDSGGFARSGAFGRVFCALMGRPRFLRAIYPTFSTGYMRARTGADRHARAQAIANVGKPATLESLAGLWASFADEAHDLRAAAPSITTPTLIVWGRRDPVISIADGRRAAKLIRSATMLELDCGHSPHTSEPDTVAQAVRTLLTQTR